MSCPFVLSPAGVRHRTAIENLTACGIEHDAYSAVGIWWWLDTSPEGRVRSDCKRCFREKGPLA